MRNYVVERLNSYFRNNYQLNRVPLLVGPSGIAKSALIKEATKLNNMRLVDIRTAFMSRLDIEGLTEKIEYKGIYYSQSCPMIDFIKCTDEYIRVAEECVKLTDEELKVSDEAYHEELRKTRDKFAEEAKVPVLLLDEITRCEPSVRQVLTKMLTDKEFMTLSMKRARVVAATNSQIGSNGEVIDIYQTNEAYDVAFYDRFESCYISPMVMNDVWLEWASNNLHKDILEQIKQTTPYDDKHFEENEISEAMVTPYKCYRTWELASNFLKSDYSKRLSENEIASFINTIIGGKTVKSRSNMKKFLEIAIKTNTSALVISPSGLGKTSRVRQIVKENDCIMIDINLSEVDRLDVEGMPVKVPLIKAIMGDSKVTRSLASKIMTVVKESKLPQYVTIRAPKKQYVDKFKEALETGKKVVIYFDECNRVQNVSVMSAIFQVISDNKLFGVEFNPNNVTTVLSCNLSDNCGDAQDLDPALCARFAIWHKKEYTQSDLTEYLKFMRDNKFNQIILDYFTSMGEKSLDVLKSVETRTLEKSASSTRGWEDLSRTLNAGNLAFMEGRVIFNTQTKRRHLSEFLHDNLNGSEVLRAIEASLSEWAGKDFVASDIVDGKSAKDIYNYILSVDTTKLAGLSLKKFVESVYTLDVEIVNYRDDFFTMFLGDNAGKFCDFYNAKVGYGQVDLVLRVGMTSKQIALTTQNILSQPKKKEDIVQDIVNELISVVTLNLPERGKVCRVIWRELKNFDQMSILNKLSSTSLGSLVLLALEDLEFYKGILRANGIEDIDDWKRVIL